MEPKSTLLRIYFFLFVFIGVFALNDWNFAAAVEKDPIQETFVVFSSKFSLLQMDTNEFYEYPENVIDGFFLKYGINQKNSELWLGSIGYDFGIGRNFVLGIEVMSSYSKVSNDVIQFDQTSIPFNAFFNAKAGLHLGGLIKFLKFFKIFAGAGGGVGGSYINVTFEETTLSKFTFNPAFHVLGGIELDLGFASLIGEYQKIIVLWKDIDPDPWMDYIVFGIRF